MSEIHRRKAITFLVTALVILTLSLGGTAKAHAATSVVTFTSPNPTGSGGFGSSVAVNRTSVVVGAPGEVAGGAAAGHAYVFGSAGVLVATLTSPNPTGSGHFGSSVAMNGTSVVVGAPGESPGGSFQAGNAYVFSSAGVLVATLTSPNPTGSGHFGSSVAMNGTSVVVGAPGESPGGSFQAGNAYLFKPTSTATVVFDSSTNMAWSGSETSGASAYDTATVTASGTVVATGTVSYTFYTNGDCSGAGSSAGTVTLTSTGAVPNSNTEGPLAAGSYSFNATYSGDSNYLGSTSPCEPFSVAKGSSSIATVVFDPSISAPWSGAETAGASAYDTATVTTSDAIVATGTVTYTFFTNGVCSGTGSSAGTVTLTVAGAVPDSNREGPPLAAGSYSFNATYSGDSNYLGSTSPCEPFSVAKGSSSIATVVFDPSISAPWSGAETAGASAYDTATVTTSDAIVATGTVTYTFFTNGVCSGTGSSAGTVTLTSTGSVPNSARTTALTTGLYSFSATYSGDSNYLPSTSPCESFTVDASTVTTALFTSMNVPIPVGSSVSPGTSVYDTATVTGVSGIAPSGTVTYNFYTNGGCAGSGKSQTVNLSGGLVPNSAAQGPLVTGYYSFQAVYSGDTNNSPSTSSCEAFIVSGSVVVGGVIVPIDKLGLLALDVALVFAVLGVTALAILYSRSIKQRNDDQ